MSFAAKTLTDNDFSKVLSNVDEAGIIISDIASGA